MHLQKFVSSTLMITAAAFLLAACGDDSPADPADASQSPDATQADAAAPGPDAMVADTQAPTTTASPAAGAFLSIPTVTLTADEPATIYYTIDGTDPTMASPNGPSPVTVANVTDSVALKYFAVDAASNTETALSSVYTITQRAMITVAGLNGTPTVTVNSQPAELTLTGTAVFDSGGQNLTVSLQATSTTTRVLLNLKAVLSAVNQGTLSGTGTIGGSEFIYYGPEVLAPAGVNSRDFVFTGIDGVTDPITIELDFRVDRMVVGPSDWSEGATIIDASEASIVTGISCEDQSYRTVDGDCRWTSPTLSPDGTKLYYGNRNMPNLTVLDLTTMTATNASSMSVLANSPNAVGYTDSVTISPNGQYLYVTFIDNAHGPHWLGHKNVSEDGDIAPLGGATTIQLVRVNRATLEVVDRVTVFTAAENTSTSTRPRGHFMSKDGTIAGVSINSEGVVAFVNLSTMMLIDTDTVTAGQQNLNVAAIGMAPSVIEFAADNSKAYLAFRTQLNNDNSVVAPTDNNGTLTVIDLATFATSTLAPTTVSTTGNFPGKLALGPDGRLFYSRKARNELTGNFAGMTIFDLVGNTQVELLADTGVYAFDWTNDGRYLGMFVDGRDLAVYDLVDSVFIDFDGNAGNGPTPFEINQGWGHELLVID